MSAQSTLEGGPGRDSMSVRTFDELVTDVTLDLDARTLDRDGRIVSGWTSIETHVVSEVGATVAVQGSPGRDEVRVSYAQRYEIDLAAGDDTLVLFKPGAGVASGGPGRDRVQEDSKAHIDLGSGRVGPLAVRSFEDATTYLGSVTGDAGANDIVVGCSTVRGGPGPDRLREFVPRSIRAPAPDRCTDLVMLGGAGHDILIGSPGRDRLIGGPGTDTAIGRGGGDVCRAERRRTCGR